MSSTLVLVLLSLVAASSSYPATSGDVPSYYPCDAVQIEGGLKVDCPFYNMPELVRVAFRTNAPNKGIKYLAMHSDFEGTVMDYLSDNDLLSGSYDTLSELVVSYSSEVTFPKLLSKLRALDTLYLDHVAVANPAAGSMNLASPKLMKFMSISYAPLYNFEAGVFPEGLAGKINFYHDNLTMLNEAAFKPLLQNGALLSYDSDGIKCDCDLSWLCRDGRDLLAQVEGKCLQQNGDHVDLQDTDAKDFSSCP